MIRVLLVDDHELIRAGIAMILRGESDMEVVGECADGADALEWIRRDPPDVVLLDVNMPGVGGVEVTRRIAQMATQTRAIILTVLCEQPFPTRLLDAGAAGYLSKGCDRSELMRAIRDVSTGRRYVGQDIAQKLALSMMPGQAADPFATLSDREMEVLLLMVRETEPKQIARQLHISPKTVSTYKYRIFEKLGVESDVGLMRLAARHRLLEDQAY
jgi:DNA-binding NarL/FixJ family response regulator